MIGQERSKMNGYDVKMDSKGRILIPIQIRNLFINGARIVDNGTDIFELRPINNEIVIAEIDVVSDLKDLCADAWRLNVVVIDVGYDNGLHTIRAKGQYDSVREFAAIHGMPECDFDECIIDEDQ